MESGYCFHQSSNNVYMKDDFYDVQCTFKRTVMQELLGNQSDESASVAKICY